jgi:hypothetical protein
MVYLTFLSAAHIAERPEIGSLMHYDFKMRGNKRS